MSSSMRRGQWAVTLSVALFVALCVALTVALLGGAAAGPGGRGLHRTVTPPGASGLADDFNGVPVDTAPPAWSMSGTGSTVVVAVPDTVDRSLRISRPAVADAVHATRRFRPLSGVVEVQARVRADDAAAAYDVLRVADGTGVVVAAAGIDGGHFTEPATGRELAPAAGGRWYSLRAVLRTAVERFDLFIDGRRVLTDARFTARVTDLAQVTAGVRAGAAGTLHLDTVSARRVPDPSVDYVVLDQFNDDPLQSQPAGHVATTTGGTVTITATPSEDDRSLLAANGHGTGEAKATRPFAPQTGTVIVQANVRTDERTGTKLALYVEDSDGGIAAAVQFDQDWLVHDDGATAHRLTKITPGEWYTLKLVLDTAAHRFDVYVDGRRYAAPSNGGRIDLRWPFREAGAAHLDQLTFGVGSGQTGTVRVDNVMVFRNPVAAPPGTVLDVRDGPYHAAGDGVRDDTTAVQRAIDDVPAGGTVLLTGGVFLTGSIRLHSDMTLWVDTGAVLLGTTDETAYGLIQKDAGAPFAGGLLRRGFVTASGADRLRIEGGGTIDGNGHKPGWDIEGGTDRPALMALTRGRDVVVRNLHVRDAATWGIVPDEIDGLLIADITIDSDIHANRDGIDVTDSHGVLIERVAVSSDDDAICFKSYSAKGVDGVVVRLSTVGRSSRANGVKFGTGSVTSFRNIVVEDVLIKHVDKAAMTVLAVDGSVVGNLAFRRVTADHALRAFFVLIGRRTELAGAGTGVAGPRWVSGVSFEGVVGDNLAEPSVVSGQTTGAVTHRVYGVLLNDVRLAVAGGVREIPADPAEYAGIYPESNHWTGPATPPAQGVYLRHVDGYTVQGLSVEMDGADARPPLAYRDATGATTP